MIGHQLGYPNGIELGKNDRNEFEFSDGKVIGRTLRNMVGI